jgi:hypothetical protein
MAGSIPTAHPIVRDGPEHITKDPHARLHCCLDRQEMLHQISVADDVRLVRDTVLGDEEWRGWVARGERTQDVEEPLGIDAAARVVVHHGSVSTSAHTSLTRAYR